MQMHSWPRQSVKRWRARLTQRPKSGAAGVQLGILVVGVEDPRLTWVEQKLLEDLGNRLYGNRN